MNKSNLREIYRNKLSKELMSELGLKNVHEVPTLDKIVVNSGIGKEYSKNSGIVEEMIELLEKITGQKPTVRKSKYSISNFGLLKKGMPNGVMVTLRGELMWDFLYKLIHVAIPKIKDFRGLSTNSFDHAGNYTLGIAEHTIFPEIDTSTLQKIRPLSVAIVINSKSKQHSMAFLRKIGFPLKNK